MKFVGTESVAGKLHQRLILQYPKLRCGRIVKFFSKLGSSNRYSLLRILYAKGMTRSGQGFVLQKLNEDALDPFTGAGGTILSLFNIMALSERD